MKTQPALDRRGSGPLGEAGLPGAVWRTYLVADGLGAAPVQQDLLDPAGAGHPEALRALQFGFGLFGSVGQTDDGASNTS